MPPMDMEKAKMPKGKRPMTPKAKRPAV
jgi:hypothetical protein